MRAPATCHRARSTSRSSDIRARCASGPFVAVAGTTGAGDDIAAQARDALRRIEVALREVGASLADVVRTRMYVTDISLWREVGAVHAEVFGDVRSGGHHGGGVRADLTGAARRDRGRRVRRRVDRYAASGANRPFASGRYGVTLITATAGKGPYRCGNTIASGSVGTPGSQRTSERTTVRDRCAAAPGRCGRRTAGSRADAPAQASRGGRTRSRQRFGAMFAARLGRPPVIGTAKVDQDGRQRLHTASLPCRQLGVTVRHDTPVNPRGTRPEPKASETVDIREQSWRCHERNAYQS